MDGLRIYFDFTLPTLLLYNFEREQYQMVMKLTPHPAELKEGHHNELNGKMSAEDKYGVVSSSTESSPVKQEFTNMFTNQTETKEGEGECSLDFNPFCPMSKRSILLNSCHAFLSALRS